MEQVHSEISELGQFMSFYLYFKRVVPETGTKGRDKYILPTDTPLVTSSFFVGWNVTVTSHNVMASQITGNVTVCSTVFFQINKKIKALHYWPFVTETTGDDGFSSQRTSNAETLSIAWHHHAHWKAAHNRKHWVYIWTYVPQADTKGNYKQ